MKDKKSIVSMSLAILAICISVIAIMMCYSLKMSGMAETAEEGDVQYVLYLGTNDKDTNEPVYTPKEAKDLLKDILNERMGGYTIQEANGGWIGDDGTEYQEYTLVIYLSDTSIEKVHALCDELIQKYNQSSVLIQSNRTITEFYNGLK